MGRKAGRAHGQRGQGVTEFALVLPVFLFLFLGVMQLGLYVLAQSALTFATMQGARAAAVAGADPAADTAVCSAIAGALASSHLDPSNVTTVTIYQGNGRPSPPSDVGMCDATGAWVATSAGWPPPARGVGATPDSVGVRLDYTFHYVIPWFGTAVKVSHDAILRIEDENPPSSAS